MRLCVEIVGGVFAALVLVVAVAVWRLSEGPVRTSFLTPYLQEAFSESGGNTIEIGETFLVWDGWARDVVLHASDIVVRDPGGRRIASLPEVALELSSSAMLQGTVAPNQVEIIAPRIRLLRDGDGKISFGGEGGRLAVPEGTAGTVEDLMLDSGAAEGAAGGDNNNEAVVLGGIIRELLSERTPGNPLSFLDEVRIRDGQIFVRDEKLGLSWAAPAADISLRRDIVGLAGDVSLGFVGHRDPATLDAAFLFDKRDGIVDLAAGFSDISLANLATAFPQLAPMGGITSRISGSIATSIALDGSVGPTGFEVQGLSGTLAIPGVTMDPLPIRDLAMKGRYDDGRARFDLDEARIRLGSEGRPGPVLTVAGVLDHDPETGGDWTIDVDAALEDVDLAELDRYWPPAVGSGARPWIMENVTGGRVQRVTAKTQVLVPQGDFDAADLASLSGTLTYSGLEVHYLRPLPPIVDIAGTAEFDADRLQFAIDSGSLLSLALGESRVEIDGFNDVDLARGIYEQLSIETKAAGPIFDALSVLEHPRLDLLSSLGLSAEGSGGALAADLGFQFPLTKSLTFDDITLQVAATVQDAVLRNVLLGQDMTDGRLALTLDQSGMELSGPLTLGGVALDARWKESFLENPKFRTVIDAEIAGVDDAGRARFGLDIGEVVSGPIAAKISYVSRDGAFSTLDVASDLKQALIDLPEIHWKKEAGTEGSLRMTIDMDDDGPMAYRDIILQAGDLVARGQARPGPDRAGLAWMSFERVAFGRSDLKEVVVEQSGGGYAVAIAEGVLDAEPFLIKDKDPAAEPAEATEATEPAAETEESSADPPRTFEPLSIRAPNLERLYFAEERRLELVNLELVRTQAGWETIRLSGSIPRQYWSPREEPSEPAEGGADGGNGEAGPSLDRRFLQLSLAPDASGSGLRLLAKSDDLGALLRAVNIADTIVGGSIQVTGSSTGPTPTHPIQAKVAARDFVMVNAPVLAKLLTVASFTGMLDILSGDGIGFQGLDGEFILDDGVASTELMRVYGAALGLTAKGTIDFDEDAIDLVGAVVPAYSVNNFLGNIPIIGPILVGREGEGLIAVTYGVKGAVTDPEVRVNPLTALAPGFLRNIFTADPDETENFRAVPERIDR